MLQYNDIVQKQRQYFNSHVTLDVKHRIALLHQLYQAIVHAESEIMDALKKDLNKSKLDSYSTEIGLVLKEISLITKKLTKWTKPKKVSTPFSHFGSRGYIYPQPYGVTLIIAPWNYPFQLALAPLVGAIAAGNTAVIKPSELTPHTSAIINKIIEQTFDPNHVTVIEGGVEASEALLREHFDYIFFTGSVSVGKIIMNAAAKHLTPLTLELGGKSPCIVHKDANLKLAAKRIAWGKFINSGQTCIAPDYLYVHEDIKEAFINHFIEATKELYYDEERQYTHLTKIVSERHFQRLTAFLNDAEATVAMGGNYDQTRLIIEPTLLTDVDLEHPIMQEEIFGPILPLLAYRSFEEVEATIQMHRNPLAFYLFTENKQLQEQLLSNVSFGGGCVNDTIYHYPQANLPFGGIGASGMGAYHGKYSFDTFTHFKSVLKQSTSFDLPVRYPTMKNGLALIKRFLK